MLRSQIEVSSFPSSFVITNERGINSPGEFSIIIDYSSNNNILLSINPLCFNLHDPAILGMNYKLQEFNYLPINPLVSLC